MTLILKKHKVRIPAKGIYLTQNSTQEELKKALKHEPKLSNFIEDNTKKQAKDDKQIK